jgi:hypothetical protein
MANRAYLYPHPRPSFERSELGLPERYYDSRHVIPIGWFFFFRTPDVVLLDVESWQEAKLVAPKAAALDLFRSRRPLLDRYLREQPLFDAAETLVSDLARWPGDYLLLEPGAVLDSSSAEEDVRHASQFRRITESLDAADPEQMAAAMSAYCERLSEDPDARLCQVLGYTYRWD